jgi:Predicted protease
MESENVMLKRLLMLLLILVLSTTTFLATIAQSQEQYYYIQTSSPQYSIVPGSEFVEPLNTSQPLYIAVLLNFTNLPSLQSYLNETYLQASHFHKWLTPSQFREYYYPSKSYVNSLISYLKSYNLEFLGNYGLILVFNGTVGSVENAFHTYINVYYYPFKNLYWFGLLGIKDIGPFYYYSNNVTPSLPYNVGKYVLGVVGIDSLDPKVVNVIKQAWHLDMVKAQSGLVSKAIISPMTIGKYFNFTMAYALWIS